MDLWRQRRLGELIRVKHGYAFLGQYFGSQGTHIVLTPGNFHESGGFKTRNGMEKRYSGLFPEEYILNEGDLLIAMTEQGEGLLGSSALIPASNLYLHNQRLGLIEILDEQECDRKFLYYLFNSRSVRQRIRATATGTKIRHTSPTRVCEVDAWIPGISEQRRIAGILSAYDDLIENCQRRIRILEEMARSIYREWFVHFRYPGHDRDPSLRADAEFGPVPSTWATVCLEEIYRTSSGGTPSRTREDYFKEGTIDWVKSQELIDGFIDGTGERITEAALHASSAKLFPAGTVLIALYGATIGKLGILARPATTNQACCALLPKQPSFGREFAFCAMYENRERIIGLRLGAAQQNISQALLRNLTLVKPPDELGRRFTVLTAPMFDELLLLQRKISNLRSTRDLLLPRLLSGEVAA